MKDIKCAELRDGKIYLEGKLVNADILGLSIVSANDIDDSDFDNPASFNDEYYSNNIPKGTNAYVIASMTMFITASGAPEGMASDSQYRPIAYLRIKPKKSRGKK